MKINALTNRYWFYWFNLSQVVSVERLAYNKTRSHLDVFTYDAMETFHFYPL